MIKNANRWAPHGLRPYGVALLALAIAFVLRDSLHGFLQEQTPYFSFVIANFLVGASCGIVPALFIAVAGFLLALYFFVPPYDSFEILTFSDLVGLVGYVSVSIVGLALIEWLQRARHETELLLQLANQRELELLKKEEERVQAENRIQKSEEKFQALAETIPDISYMRRVDGRFEYVNDKFYELTGLPPGSLEGDGWRQALHPYDADVMESIWHKVAETEEPEMAELRFKVADGSYRLFSGWVRCTGDKNNRVIRWAATLNTSEEL